MDKDGSLDSSLYSHAPVSHWREKQNERTVSLRQGFSVLVLLAFGVRFVIGPVLFSSRCQLHYHQMPV